VSQGQKEFRIQQPRLPDADRSVSTMARPHLAASWQRSEDYGVPVDAVDPVFTGSLNTESLLYECGSEVLRGLQSTLPNEPISLMVADRDGLVLSRLCNDKAIVDSLDRVHLAPGFTFSERTAGTNGLGLSLADRAPTLVRAEEHYCTALRGYTCAAAPVLDPRDGDLVGTINLTTWSQSSSELLLALAQSAAGNTTALMQVRASGSTMRAAPRGEVFHVWAHRSTGDADACVSPAWRSALSQVEHAVRAGQVIAVVGEDGVGKSTLVSLAHRAVARRERVLTARVPGPDDIASWLALWTPELEDQATCIIVSGVDTLPAWTADELTAVFTRAKRRDTPQPFVFTAADYAAIPDRLSGLIDAVVELPALRLRGRDVLPLAHQFGRQERRRDLTFSAAASRALTNYDWPGNVRELKHVIRSAAARTEHIDAHHLAPEIFTSGGHTLTRLETFERDELVRCLTAPGATATQAALELGVSRATVYRKIAQYRIQLPGRSGDS
jgi:sigma-54 dependent transcriptional regulator, acetoin dehydrogenase operon transcriptional activator AcoR